MHSADEMMNPSSNRNTVAKKLESDVMKKTITERFDNVIKHKQFLSADTIQAELEQLKWEFKKRHIGQILTEPSVGPLFKGRKRSFASILQ